MAVIQFIVHLTTKHSLAILLIHLLLVTAPAALSEPVSLAGNMTAATTASNPWKGLNRKGLKLRSEAALVEDDQGNVIYDRTADTPLPIASITKLMTAMVVLDKQLPLDEKITITKADRDLVRLTGSRLKYGAALSRKELLTIALMASENRAAHALGRSYPGGLVAFVEAMNNKAASLGMKSSRFVDPVGLDADNVASARDLMRLIRASDRYPLIKHASSLSRFKVRPYKRLGPLVYGNTNRLIKNKAWDIGVSKTGYINESGRCLVMQAKVDNQDLHIVLLNSFGKLTPFGDSNRIRRWLRKSAIAPSQI